MKKIFSLLLLSLTACTFALAQTGQQFPSLQGQTLTGKSVNIPSTTKGKYTLIGIAYSQKADTDLKTWFQPVYETFLDTEVAQGGFMPESSYDVNVYFIAMIKGINQAASGKIEKEMKEKIDKKLQPHVIAFSGDFQTYQNALKMTEKDTPYFFVLDENGKVVFTTSGKYTQKKLEQVEEILD